MILNDHEICVLATRHQMIDPFVGHANKDGISYGLSSYGYDVRLGRSFKAYIGGSLLDPVHVTEKDFVTFENEVYVIPPKGFVLAHTMEYLRLPRDVTGMVKDKSTYARCGITLQNTVLEAGWEGQVTLEITNHLDRPVVLRSGHGIAQVVFFQGTPCTVSYGDRKGKYQGQTGVTIPRLKTEEITHEEPE